LPTGKLFLGKIVLGKIFDKKFAKEFVTKIFAHGRDSVLWKFTCGKTIHTKFAHGKIFLLEIFRGEIFFGEVF